MTKTTAAAAAPKTPAQNTTDTKPASRTAPIIATGALPEGFTPPAKAVRAGGAARYPFDDLGVGAMFSVKNKTARGMVGPVARANKRYRNELKGADGKVAGTTQDREFYAVDVDADTAAKLVGSPHEGATVLIVRSK